MKNEVLLSTILLLNPVANVAASEVGQIKNSIAKVMQYLADLSFESPEVKTGEFWGYDEQTNTSFRFNADYKMKVSFIISRDVETNNYSYNGRDGNGEMEYEVLVQKVDTKTGEILWAQDSVFFAKRLSENKFRIFDCNSTSNCWDANDDYISHADFYIFDSPKGRILKTVKNSRHDFDEYVFGDKVLHESH